ncbi:hypothetical protein CTI14_27360 [Methylobacterium radiotolerans]|nr:hypothetical protein CTI14_27360 [Methylobacterium radiotolerans]
MTWTPLVLPLACAAMPETFTAVFETAVACVVAGSKYTEPATVTDVRNPPPSLPPPVGGWNWLIGTIVSVCAPGDSAISAVVVAPVRLMTSPVSSIRKETASSAASIDTRTAPRPRSETPGRYSGVAVAFATTGAA